MEEADNEKSDIHLREAEKLFSSDSLEEALKKVDDVLEIDRLNIEAYKLKQQILSKLGRYREANDVCDEILMIGKECDNRTSTRSKGPKQSRFGPCL